MSIGPPHGPAWSLLSRPGSYPSMPPPAEMSIGNLLLFARRCPEAAMHASEELSRRAAVFAEEASKARSEASAATDEVASLLATAQVQELAASAAAGAARDHARRAAEASAAAVAVVQHQPKPWIASCRDCDEPEEAEVCPRCDLPRCQSCGNQGLCCKSPEAQSGRQRLQERQSDSATGGYGDPEAIGGPTNDLQRLCGIDGHRCQQCLCLALLKGGAPCCFGKGPKTHDDGPPLSHAFLASWARGSDEDA